MAPATDLMPYGADEQQLTHVETDGVNPDAFAIMERVAIDSQIATAKRYPRSLSLFLERAQMMACIDEETAKSCFYRRPVGKEGSKTVYAEGESIRLAEIVAASYDNLAIRAMIVEITPRYVKAVAMARDLERNYMAAAECVESTVDRNGKPYSERQRMLIAKVAQSKAYRDAIFRVVPKALCKPATIAAQEVALGKGLTLEQRRERVLQWINSLNISPERIWKALGIAGPEEMGTSEMLTLTGIRSAIKDGDTNVDEAFPAEQGEQGKPTAGNAAVKELLKNGKKAPAAPGAGEKAPEGTTEPFATESPAVEPQGSTGTPKPGQWKCEDDDCGAVSDHPGRIQRGKTAGTLICPECASKNIHQVQEADEPDLSAPTPEEVAKATGTKPTPIQGKCKDAKCKMYGRAVLWTKDGLCNICSGSLEGV